MQQQIDPLERIAALPGQFREAKALAFVVGLAIQDRLPAIAVPGFPASGRGVGVDASGGSLLALDRQGDRIAIERFAVVKDQVNAIAGTGAIVKQR